MKKLYLSLLLAGLSVAPAMGQGTVYSFPKPRPQGVAIQQAPPLHQPTAIDDKSKGITMYAGQSADESKRRSWVKWQLNNSSNFTRLYEYIHHASYNNDQQRGMLFGAYDSANKSYYGFFAMSYTYGDMPTALAKIDIATGDTTNVFNFAPLSEPDAEQTAWYQGLYKYAMAFDPVNEVMYALGAGYKEQVIDGDSVTVGYSRLYEVNLEATSIKNLFTPVKDFDVIYMDFCFDAQGNAWFAQKYAGSDGVAKGTQLVKMDGDNFNVIGEPVKMKSEWGEELDNSKNYYFSTMSFDYSTGDLYYIPCGAYSLSSTIYKVNTTTGLLNSVAWFMSGNQFRGLYIPYLTADDAAAPARVSGLDVQPDVNGNMTDTIKWVNPAKSWDGNKLENLQSVKIYRKNAGYATTELTGTKDLLDNSKLIATVQTADTAAAMSWVDSAPEEGINTYYVLAANDKGNGVLDSIRCYMGVDVPGEVNNITLTKNGTGVDIAWEAPQKGANNGYITTDGLTYKLTRLPDSVVVAENLTDTKFTDNTLGEQQLFSYIIQACNAKGAGAATKSGEIMAGAALKTPIKLTFDTQSDADRWTRDPNYSLYFYYAGGYDDTNKCYIAYGDYYGNRVNGTLVSPPLYLEEGKNYRFTTDLQADFFDDAYFDFYTGVGTNSESQEGATIIGTHEGVQTAQMYQRDQYEDYFTAPSTGTYYYTLKVSAEKYNIFRFYGLNVDYVSDNDLAALSVDNVIEAVAKQANTCTVRVRNLGSKEQSGYTVKLLMDNEGKMIEVGSATATAEQTLKMGQSADVEVSFNPPYDDVWDFYGVVVANGDEDHSNDTTAVKSITVLEEGTQAWTNIVTGDYEGKNNDALIKNYGTDEYSQSVYYPSEINAQGIAMIKRIGWIYDGNGLTDRTNPVDVKIYLAHTDMTSFDNKSADKIADDERELVAEGQIVFEPGADHIVSFTLDTPFEYNKEQNLAVICEKSGSTGVDFCALWHMFHTTWQDPVVYRTLLKTDTWDVYPSLPVLYLGIYDATGVERVQLMGADMAYADGTLAFDKVVNAEVYTLGGKLVSSFKSSSAKLNLAKGVYVVRATDADGNVVTKKLNVK